MQKLIYPVKDFKENWYSAQDFGNKTYYGYHEGEDINLNTGGNTDLGYRLYAIDDGEVTSVESLSTGFGKHIHIKHNVGGRDVWCHYAHCETIFVKEGDRVARGDRVATIGSTGSSKYAHLHWAIKVKPTGINAIAHNLEELKSWTNPIEFIENGVENTVDNSDELTQLREDRDKNWNLYQEMKADYEKQKTITSETKKELNGFMETLAGKLKTIVDKGEIIGAVDRLLTLEDQLNESNKKLLQQEKKHEIEKLDLKEEIKQLSLAVEEAQRNNTKLLKRLEELEVKVDDKVIVEKPRFSVIEWLKSLIFKG